MVIGALTGAALNTIVESDLLLLLVGIALIVLRFFPSPNDGRTFGYRILKTG